MTMPASVSGDSAIASVECGDQAVNGTDNLLAQLSRIVDLPFCPCDSPTRPSSIQPTLVHGAHGALSRWLGKHIALFRSADGASAGAGTGARPAP